MEKEPSTHFAAQVKFLLSANDAPSDIILILEEALSIGCTYLEKHLTNCSVNYKLGDTFSDIHYK